jgi:hypothetical protein
MPALTTGTLTCTGPGDTRTYGEGWFRGDQTLECTSAMDDPRVTGPGTLGRNYACYPAANQGCIYWGTTEIVGPDGTWVGNYTRGDSDGLDTEPRAEARLLGVPHPHPARQGADDGGVGPSGDGRPRENQRSVAGMIDLQPDDELLDIGCGPGTFLATKVR